MVADAFEQTRVRTYETRGSRLAAFPATGQGAFGIKRQIKCGLQRCVRATHWRGLGLPARILRFSEHGKTADYAAAAPETCADGNALRFGLESF
jgi:hypothetical protein